MCEDEAGGQQHAFILRDIRPSLSRKCLKSSEMKNREIIQESAENIRKQRGGPEDPSGGRRRAGVSVLGQQLGVQESDHFPVVIDKRTATAVEEHRALLIHLWPEQGPQWSVRDAGMLMCLFRSKGRQESQASLKKIPE